MYLWRQRQNLCRPDPVFGTQLIAFTSAPQGTIDVYTIAAVNQLTDLRGNESNPVWRPR